MNTATDLVITRTAHLSFREASFGPGATLTRVEYTVGSDRYAAVRWWRADHGCSGIELYKLEDGVEEFFGYARAECAVTRIIDELVIRHAVAFLALVGTLARWASQACRPLELS